MFEKLLIDLGINIAASVIIGGVAKLFSKNTTVSETDVKDEIAKIIQNNDINKIDKIYNSMIENNLMINNKIINGGDGGSAYSESGSARGGDGGSIHINL